MSTDWKKKYVFKPTPIVYLMFMINLSDLNIPFFLPDRSEAAGSHGNNKLSLSNYISTELPLTQLRWVTQLSAEKRHMVRLITT